MIEIQSSNSRIARNIFEKLCDGCKPNIWTTDSLKVTKESLAKHGWPTEFDVILGNPPFQKGRNMMFYVYFIDLAYELLKENGYLIYVIPNKVLIPNKANESLLNFDTKIIYHTLNNKYFQEISTTTGAIISQKNKYSNKTKIIFNNGNEIIDIHNPTPTSYDDIHVKHLSDKILLDYNKYLPTLKEPPSTDFIYISRVWTRYSPDKPSGGSHVFVIENPPSGHADGRFIQIPTDIDKETLIWFLTRSDIMRFITKIYAGAMNVPAFLWSFIPHIALKEKTNDAVFQIFKLTKEEQKLIKSVLNDGKTTDEKESTEGGAKRFKKTRKLRR